MNLAHAYIDLLTAEPQSEDMEETENVRIQTVDVRRRLQSLLMSDCVKDIAAISQRIEKTQLHPEKIILLGKVMFDFQFKLND